MQIARAPRHPPSLLPVGWRPDAPRGGNHIPADRSVEIGQSSLKFSPSFADPAYVFGGGVAQAARGVEVMVEHGSAAGVLEGLRAALEEIPQVILDRVRQVRVLARQDDAYDRYFERAYRIPGFQAVAAGGFGAISFFGGRPYATSVLFHELGHNVAVSSSAWRDAARADDATITRLASLGTLTPVELEPVPDPARRARWTPRLAPGAVTPYGGSNAGEDIAESLRLLLAERHFGRAFASIAAGDGAASRPVRFAEAYPARTAALERAVRTDLDGDGRIGG